MSTTMKCYLLLFCAVALVSCGNPVWLNGDPKLPFPQWHSAGQDVCDSSNCHVDGAANWLNFTIPQNNVNTICTNLVGDAGQYVYVVDERRMTCIQVLADENAYKWTFSVHRSKCDDFTDNLDFHTCVEVYNDILSGYTTFCDGGKIWVTGGNEQVGCFMMFAAAQQGWCART